MKPPHETKLLWFGDLVQPSGFGRIGNAVTTRLHQRGYQVFGGSIPYAGYPPSPLPYYVWGFGGVDIWNRVTQMANDIKPDVIVCCQDYPYSQQLFHGCRIDWSVTKLIIVTPIDGTPIHPDWLKMTDLADATLVISRFGVEAMRQSGRQVSLLHPGVDSNEFYPPVDSHEVAAIRAQMGIAPTAFVLGAFMMNQGRKAIPEVLELFFEFAKDKPEALLYLDMDKTSMGGWDIPSVLAQMGVDSSRVRYREDAFKAGLLGLRERFLLCDISCQLAHREGFGLPNLESQACKVPPMALDWCSGSEITGSGKGILVRRERFMSRGTWGGARDAFPDMQDALKKLNAVYANPAWRATIAQAGYEWAVQQTWDNAATQFETVLKQVLANPQESNREPQPNFTLPALLTDTAAPISTPAANSQHFSPVLQLIPNRDEVSREPARHNQPPNDGNHSQ